MTRIHRHDAHALPLLVQEPRVLAPPSLHPAAGELRGDVEVEEGAGLRGDDAWVGRTGGAGDGAGGAVGGGGADVRGGGEVERAEVAVERDSEAFWPARARESRARGGGVAGARGGGSPSDRRLWGRRWRR